MNTFVSRSPSVPKIVSATAAAYVIVGGCLSLLGWLIDVYRLTDWWGTGITIKANASIAFCTAGVALFLAVLRPTARRVIQTLAILTALIGGLTLFEHVARVDLGIDTLLFDEPSGTAGTASPGRMGPPASTSFLTFGIALLLLTGGSRSRSVAAGLATAVLGIGTLSLTGFFYGAEAMYAVPRLTGIATQTATMIAAMSLGVIAAQPDRQPMQTLCEDSTAGVLARRLLPAAFIMPLTLGWLRVEGQRAQLYDFAFGSALRTVMEIAILGGLSWWIVQAVRMRDQQRRRAEEVRRSSEQRLQTVLDASAVPFTVLAPVKDSAGAIVDFKWQYLNPAAAAVLRQDVQGLVGRRVADVLPGAWREAGVFENYVAVALHREVREFELHTNMTGVESWFQVVASPLDDNVAAWFADTTERKRQEIELRNADRRKDEFLATLAHELRNPLAPIRQAAMLARRAGVTEPQRQWCNEVIERQVQHMSLLLNDLLDVSRITRGILELRKQSTELAALVDAAIETARPLIEARRHTLNVEITPAPVALYVDPLRMSQVIANLLNNAAKYTNSGGQIKISAGVENAELVLRVSDNGIGIPNEELSSIFNMFSQVKSAQERSEGGLGIGLALTRGLIDLHGGTIEVSSAGPGHGSTFTVRIPRASVSTEVRQSQATSSPTLVLSRRILVADDNRDAAESLAMLLRGDGHDVSLADDGEAAWRVFAETNPEVVLLDLGMPRLSGYEVAKRIRARSSSALVIAITGWGQSSDRMKSANVGFDHHLTKPVDYALLSELLAPSAKRGSVLKAQDAKIASD